MPDVPAPAIMAAQTRPAPQLVTLPPPRLLSRPTVAAHEQDHLAARPTVPAPLPQAAQQRPLAAAVRAPEPRAAQPPALPTVAAPTLAQARQRPLARPEPAVSRTNVPQASPGPTLTAHPRRQSLPGATVAAEGPRAGLPGDIPLAGSATAVFQEIARTLRDLTKAQPKPAETPTAPAPNRLFEGRIELPYRDAEGVHLPSLFGRLLLPGSQGERDRE